MHDKYQLVTLKNGEKCILGVNFHIHVLTNGDTLN